MKASYKKETLQDPEDGEKTYENYTLNHDVKFCCDAFKNYCKKFSGWDYGKGKFSIVDQITYEGHLTSPIDFCPFCGEKIEYREEKSPKPKKQNN